MAWLRSFLFLSATASTALAAECPFGHQSEKRQVANQAATNGPISTEQFLNQFTISTNNDTLLTTDVGGPIDDQNSLKAGRRGPTLLEDFILRQKITHFDHERVPERAVHARGAGAHGVFESYGDWSNITSASFLHGAGKQTPTFVRFSTVAGSRGSSDTARDVHGFATRFYTDEGNYDIVGNNIPVFFIQDAILFPDLIHAVKPNPQNEIPQAATAHDTAWDFFSQQPSTLHTLMWAMSGHGIVRSYRHMDGFGVHTFRMVKDDGSSKLVKFHWKSLQGKAALTWDEAQQAYGKNPDYHREDLFNAIAKGQSPQWEFGVQLVDEADALRYGFDLLDPTKFIPEELVPVTPLGKMTLNRNPTNYFAETEQVMYQPGHIVRGIDFSDDPLLQGRIFSYLDTQLNRNGGPNFEQLPINQPRVPFHNNNRDGAGQMYIHSNQAAYTPNSYNNGPRQASAAGRAFRTTPGRKADGNLVREKSPTFEDYYTQPRLFFNSLSLVEQQMVINAMRFETAHIQSPVIKQNVIAQLNKVDNHLARQVARAIGLPEPGPDGQYYHNNRTENVGVFGRPLRTIAGLNVGILTSVEKPSTQVQELKDRLGRDNVNVFVVGERMVPGIDMTYSAADATAFDGVIVADGTGNLFNPSLDTQRQASTLYPTGRPLQIILDAYRFGKPIGFIDDGLAAYGMSAIQSGPGVFASQTFTAPTTQTGGNIDSGFTLTPGKKHKRSNMTTSAINGVQNATTADQFPTGGFVQFGPGANAPPENVPNMAAAMRRALKTFKFLNRFPTDYRRN